MATPVAKNAYGTIAAPTVGSGLVCVWRVSGVWRQEVCFKFVRLAETGHSLREGDFTINLH